MTSMAANYPIQLAVDATAAQGRLGVFFRIILAIPHLIILYFLEIAQFVITFLAWFAIMFTGRYPRRHARLLDRRYPLAGASERLYVAADQCLSTVQPRRGGRLPHSADGRRADRGTGPPHDLLPHLPDHPALHHPLLPGHRFLLPDGDRVVRRAHHGPSARRGCTTSSPGSTAGICGSLATGCSSSTSTPRTASTRRATPARRRIDDGNNGVGLHA